MASRVTFIQCDLASTASVREAANFFLESFGDKKPRLDVLMCNAGIMLAPPAVTVDGYEIHFGTNHVGHAFLIKLLLPTLRATANGPGAGNARIILNSSLAAELAPRCGIDFDAVRSRGEGMGHIPIPAGWARYGQSKLANMLYARALARKEPEITTVSVHPGVIKTGLVTSVSFANRMLIYASNPFSILTPEQGVKNQLWAATVDKTTLTPGEYYTPVGVTGAQTAAGKAGKNDDLADKLWDWTQKELAKL